MEERVDGLRKKLRGKKIEKKTAEDRRGWRGRQKRNRESKREIRGPAVEKQKLRETY